MSSVEQLPPDRSPFRDQVTGLTSAPMFRELLSHALLRSRRSPMDLALLRINLDSFPAETEDAETEPDPELLRQVGGRIAGSLRAGDVAARLGGSEFAVLLENTWSPSDASAVARRILAAIRRPFRVGDEEVKVTVSVGIAVGAVGAADQTSGGGTNGGTVEAGRAGGADPAEAFADRAALALQAALRSGGDTFALAEPDPRGNTVQLLARTADLREGLERDEIEVAYQPVVTIDAGHDASHAPGLDSGHDAGLDSGHVVGFEVLVRWNHPRLGLLTPREFVPVAESSGLVGRLGDRVLRQSLGQLASWQRNHPERSQLSISVNIAGGQLRQESFTGDVCRLVSASGITPGSLILELDEQSLRTAARSALDGLRRLRHCGVRIYLDDWRAASPSPPDWEGFDALPLDGLKLSGEVVAQIPGQAAIDEACEALALASTSGFDPVVAKGVETEEQWQALAGLGYRLCQGYQTGTPQDATETGALLAR